MEKPELKIEDLDKEPRRLMRTIIREYCITCNIFKGAHKEGIGAEETTEIVEELINNGFLVVTYNPRSEGFKIIPWFMDKEV